MALSKKNSRAITVGGTEYRWAFSPDSGYATIVVQIGDGPGQRVEAMTGRWQLDDRRAVTPAVIVRLIEYAISRGWRPTEPGPPMVFHRIEDLISFN